MTLTEAAIAVLKTDAATRLGPPEPYLMTPSSEPNKRFIPGNQALLDLAEAVGFDYNAVDYGSDLGLADPAAFAEALE